MSFIKQILPSKSLIRKSEEGIFKSIMYFSVATIFFLLIAIIYGIISKGLPALSWEMISSVPEGGFYFGKGGGILNAIVGSLYLALGSTIIALVIGLPVALFLNIHLVNHTKFVNSIRFLLDLLWGVPSIVYGVFAFSIMLYIGTRVSLLAGMITVALFILPVIIRTIDEAMKSVPRDLLEVSLSLGSTKTETAYRIFVRQCMPAIVTATILAFGRAIGDAAAVILTTGFTDSIPTSLFQPTATLSLSVFFQLSSPVEEVKARAYASAALLTIIVLIISLSARYFSSRYNKSRIK
jgi:phosphate transport system permease protein